MFLRQNCCIVPVYYIVGVPKKNKMLYSTCVLYSGCFEENLECCIVLGYNIVGVSRKFRMLYSTCVLYSGCLEENLECCIVNVY